LPKDTSLKNSIVGGVVSTLIAAAIVYFVPSVWDGLKYSVSAIWFGLTYLVPIPVWAMIVLISLILPTLFVFASKLAQNPAPSWRDYTRDRFKGMIWRWRYSSTVGGCHNVWCYCPEDDTSLVYSQLGGVYDPKQIVLTCETCGRQFGPFEGDREYFIASIERQIDRKIRTEEWRSVVVDKTDAA
jgi:hypothetical protein